MNENVIFFLLFSHFIPIGLLEENFLSNGREIALITDIVFSLFDDFCNKGKPWKFV